MLLVMLRSLTAAGLPLVNAVLGVAVGVAGALSLTPFISMQDITPVLAIMLGLAVGIDYTLFIVHRHRTQMVTGMDKHESIGLAIGTTTPMISPGPMIELVSCDISSEKVVVMPWSDSPSALALSLIHI